MRIEFGSLKIGDIGKAHIADCLERNWVSSGPKVKQFEQEWGALFDYKNNKAVSSGTDACLNACLALYGFGAKPGDDVIVPALSFIATANAVRAAGFTPRFVDIKRETLNIDHDLIEKAITKNTKAIMVVHTMGRPCEMDKIHEIAAKNRLLVIEDCCEAHGAKYNGDYVGSKSFAAAFSFYIAHLVCCGEGGMVSTMRDDVAAVIESTRSHGRRDGHLYFDFPNFGLNSKMNDLEASIGLDGISKFWETFTRRHAIMMRIHQEFAPFKPLFWASEQDNGCVNCPHAYSITFKDPRWSTNLKSFLGRNGIHWKRNFGSIPTQHGAFSYLGHKLGDFPNAEYVGEHGVHFGVHQYLEDDDVTFMIDAIKDYMNYVAGAGGVS